MASKVFIIEGQLAGLNEYINAERTNRILGATLKKAQEGKIRFAIQQQLEGWSTAKPVEIDILWIEPNRRRDKDNIVFAKKFIFDAMVRERVIPNDGWKNIVRFTDFVDVSDEPKIVVTVSEVDDGSEIVLEEE